jgi:hypothetical protein
MSLGDDRNWAAQTYCDRAEAIDAEQTVTYFFLAATRDLPIHADDRLRFQGQGRDGGETGRGTTGRSLLLARTTVRGRQSTQDIALFVCRDLESKLSGSGLVVVSFEIGGEVACRIADAWFERTDALLREKLVEQE